MAQDRILIEAYDPVSGDATVGGERWDTLDIDGRHYVVHPSFENLVGERGFVSANMKRFKEHTSRHGHLVLRIVEEKGNDAVGVPLTGYSSVELVKRGIQRARATQERRSLYTKLSE